MMGRFLELVALAALGLSGTYQTAVATSAVQETVKKPIRNDVIEPLKEYVYARYDVASLMLKRDDLPELEAKLGKALAVAGLPAEALQNIKAGKRSKELEAFFDEQGLSLRAITFIGTSSPMNYELVKIDSREEKETSVLGIAHKYTKVRITEPELITNSFTYLAQKKNLNTVGVTNAVWNGRNTLEYRAKKAEELARIYYDGEKKEFEKLEEHSKDWKKIDEYFFGKKDKRPHKLFLEHMGTLLHHLAVKDIYKSSMDESDFTRKILPVWERDCEYRGAMLLVDDFDLSEVCKKLVDKDARDLRVDIHGHRETRGLLAQMHHGNPHHYLGDLFKVASVSSVKEMAVKKIVSTVVLDFFAAQVIADRKNYNNIDVSDFAKGKEGIIFAQFGNLTDSQIRNLAKDTFNSIYQDKTLKEYAQDRAEEIMRKYN
jgi:hypothetical protein